MRVATIIRKSSSSLVGGSCSEVGRPELTETIELRIDWPGVFALMVVGSAVAAICYRLFVIVAF